ncbi:DarT ssDNA thymidine ADP-ribosyltransferase family protein [Desulfoplanes formicivorans]|uniref:DarT ssDNA thymidine ADP-ribosyltransferase family protein n=1 Tax=Desulfoplanes formicivorans TaxID=1592317 RepID=UPI0009F41B40|nr:DarT ssDNA thymidine ADP-ribosyltransferase family protein [Desulfoplanes formicivorans]
MNQIQQECNSREITRLCHFTQSRNLAHIFDEPFGLYSTRTLQSRNMPHNPTDPDRYDGRDDLVCCSIEYPNTYYFVKVRERDHLFKDWVVLLIKPSYLWHSDTCFCPCNAARSRGEYIQAGIHGFRSLYASTSPGISFSRSSKHLSAAPTDIQAEVLLRDPIPLDSITGIAVHSEEQAQREICRLKLQGISIDKPIYIAPDFFKRAKLSELIQRGVRATETLYRSGGRHGL